MKLKKLFWLAPGLLVMGVFLFFNSVFSSDEQVTFSEICPRNCAAKEKQWLEFYNKSEEVVDISGWKLFINGESEHRINLTSSTDSFLIQPNEFFVVAYDPDNFLSDYPSYVGKLYDSTWTYTLSGEVGKEIGLKDNKDNFIWSGMPFTFSTVVSSSLERIDFEGPVEDSSAWVENISSPTPGQRNYCLDNNCLPNQLPEAKIKINKDSFILPTQEMIYFDGSESSDPDGNIVSYDWTVNGTSVSVSSSFYYTFISVNSFVVALAVTDDLGGVGTSSITISTFANSTSTTSTTDSELLINEFLVNPAEGNEWIEIYNNSSSSIDLSGWSLWEGAGEIISPTGTIASQNFGIFEFNNKLNNTGGDVVILKKNDEIMNSVCYGNYTENCLHTFSELPDKGNTIARLDNNFYETTSSTPGFTNIIVAPVNAPSGGGGGGSSVISTTKFQKGQIVINELVSDPSDDEVEFVELYNPTAETINLAGAWLEDGSEAQTSLSGSLSGQGFLVIENPKGSLNNSGDLIILYNSAGEEIDKVVYGSYDDGNIDDNAPLASDPFSLARKVDGQDSDYDYYDFVLTSAITPGEKNKIISLTEDGEIVEQVIGKSDIFINEILPNPIGSDEEEEFIELKNSGVGAVNLTGWSIADATNKKYKITSGQISADGLFLLKRKMTNISLNNSGEEEVKLYSSTGALVDSIKYSGSIKENLAYAKQDGAFFWTTTPTPEKENIIKGEALAPIISIDAETTVAVGESILFDASDTIDPDNEEMEFVWDFGDGNKGDGVVVKHQFNKVGVYNVTLKVIDATKNESTKKIVVTVKSSLFLANSENSDFQGVILSEVLPNPEGSDEGEFLELYNQSLDPVDLSGLKLDDEDGGSKPYIIPDGTIINSGAYLVFPKSETKLAFNNTTDKVRLLDYDKNILWEVLYDDAVEGSSYIQDEDENWTWTGTITPGKANVLTGLQNNTLKKTTKRSVTSKAIIQTTLSGVRNNDVGDLINTTGTVAVLPGILGSQIFYITDDTSGVQVYMYKKDFPELKIGDAIEVTGEISELYGETRIKVKEKGDIKKLDYIDELKPISLEIAEIGENNEGSLVKISGEVTEIKSSYLYIDDGTDEVQVYFKAEANISKQELNVGDLLEVVGLVHQTKSGFQILPRSQSDIVKTGVIESDALKNQNIESSGGVAEKYLTATAGGLTSILFGLFIRNKRTHIIASLKKISGFGLAFIRRKTK